MDGEEKKHSVDSGKEYYVEEEKHSTGPGEKKNGNLIEEAYLYITSSTYRDGYPDCRKRVIQEKAKQQEGEKWHQEQAVLQVL